MKKNFPIFFIIFLASIIIMIPTMQKEYFKGHDTFFHVANINALKDQISLTNPLAKEPLKEIARNFGYGTRLFYPPIPHLIAAYFTKIFSNVKIGMRLTQWLTFFLSGLTFWLLAKKLFKNKKIALLGSILYMTAPYHLTEVFIRDAFSEMFIPISIPLIILGLLYLIEQNYFKFYLYFIIGYTLAIYSHLAMSIYFTIIIILTFFPLYWKAILTKKNIGSLCLASIFILIFTSPFWLSLLETKNTSTYAIFMPYYITGKGDLRFSVINPLIYLDFSLPHTYDFIRYHMQLGVTLGVFVSLFYFLKNKTWSDKKITFLALFTILSIIMTTKLWPWYYTPDLLQTLQFPWRLCLYVSFGSILFAMFPLVKIEKKAYFNKIITGGIIITLIGSYYYTYHVDDIIVDQNNINYNLGMGNQEEYLPKNVVQNYEYYQNRSSDIYIKKGEGEINLILNDVPTLKFEVVTDKNVTIEFPRLFYNGYILKKDSEKITVYENEVGFVEAKNLESGTYELKYVGQKSTHFGRVISIITFLSIIIYVFFIKKLFINKKL